MRFRTKLVIAFGLVGLMTNAACLAVMYRMSHEALGEQYRAKLLSIAAAAAAGLDGETLKMLRAPGDEASPDFAKLHSQLRRIRDANRREDTYLKMVFTVTRPDPGGPLRMGPNAADDPAFSTHLGETYRQPLGATLDLAKMNYEEGVVDQFGSWVRAHAPVRDRSGAVVGAVVVEVAEGRAQRIVGAVARAAGISMALVALASVATAFLLGARVSRPLHAIHAAVDAIAKGNLDTRAAVAGKDEFGELGAALNTMAAGLQERDRVKSAFARYVSSQVADSILSEGESALAGHRRQVTVMFTDIRGFSTMSERLPPEKVVAILNEYFERMVDIVFRHKGTLDKFLGDGLMVLFGAPETDPYQEEHAIEAALDMQRELRHMSRKWEADGVHLRIGIGINSGPAIVGNIGSSRRMEYTAIGDTVNLASRLQSATKDLHVGILVSEYTYNAVRGAFAFNPMGSIEVRGRQEPVNTYALAAAEPSPDRAAAVA